MARIPAEGMDPEEFEIPERKPKHFGPRTAKPARERTHTSDALQHVLENVPLDRPSAPMELVTGRHPEWAVVRAFATMVERGILTGPGQAPRQAGGKTVWYWMRIPGRTHPDYVAWFDGAWRRRPYPLSGDWLVKRANLARRENRSHNRRVHGENEFRSRGCRLLERPPCRRSFASGMKKAIMELPVVDWDGNIFLPSGTQEMEDVVEWRKFTKMVRVRRCKRCGNDYPVTAGTDKAVHPRDECNVIIARLVMDT